MVSPAGPVSARTGSSTGDVDPNLICQVGIGRGSRSCAKFRAMKESGRTNFAPSTHGDDGGASGPIHPIITEASLLFSRGADGRPQLSNEGLELIRQAIRNEGADMGWAMQALVHLARHIEQEWDAPATAAMLLRVAAEEVATLQERVDRGGTSASEAYEAAMNAVRSLKTLPDGTLTVASGAIEEVRSALMRISDPDALTETTRSIIELAARMEDEEKQSAAAAALTSVAIDVWLARYPRPSADMVALAGHVKWMVTRASETPPSLSPAALEGLEFILGDASVPAKGPEVASEARRVHPIALRASLLVSNDPEGRATFTEEALKVLREELNAIDDDSRRVALASIVDVAAQLEHQLGAQEAADALLQVAAAGA